MIETTQAHPVSPKRFYHIQVEPRQSIRIFGDDTGAHQEPTPFDKTFKIGDQAEYDSYNFRYHGEIVGIGAKTVTIQHPRSKQTSRLSLIDFAWRNNDFVLAEVERSNHIESFSI